MTAIQRPRWTPEQVQCLRDHYASAPWPVLCEMVQHSRVQTVGKARKLGLSRPRTLGRIGGWLPEDDALLAREWAAGVPAMQTSAALSGRSEQAIRTRIRVIRAVRTAAGQVISDLRRREVARANVEIRRTDGGESERARRRRESAERADQRRQHRAAEAAERAARAPARNGRYLVRQLATGVQQYYQGW